MDEKLILDLVSDKYFIAAMLIAIVFYFIIRGKQRSPKAALHMIRIGIACVLIFAISLCAQELVEKFHLTFIKVSYIELFYQAAIAFLLLRESFLIIDQVSDRLARTSGDAITEKTISHLLKAVACICGVLLFGEYFGISFAGLLTFGGIGGIAVGLACKNILSNFFSGIVLYFDRPFDIGDWVRSEDRKVEGIVEEIGWRLTRIKTFEHYPLYIPNDVFSSICIENLGRRSNFRIKLQIGLRYDDAGRIQKVTEQLQSMLQADELIDNTQKILVCFDEFGESSLNIMIYCFAKTTSWSEFMDVQHKVYLKIVDVVQSNGAEFAFTTRTLYLEKDAG